MPTCPEVRECVCCVHQLLLQMLVSDVTCSTFCRSFVWRRNERRSHCCRCQRGPRPAHHSCTFFHYHFVHLDDKCPRFSFCFQENFAAVPKRVWADVVRKLAIKTNASSNAADLCVHSRSRASLHFVTSFSYSLCSSYIRLGCLYCD
jgi:hypothetical protein